MKSVYIFMVMLCFSVEMLAQAPTATTQQSAVPVTKPGAYTNTTINYIRTWEPSMPTTDTAAVKAGSVVQVKQSTQYIDGLGRPLQTVSKGMGVVGRILWCLWCMMHLVESSFNTCLMRIRGR